VARRAQRLQREEGEAAALTVRLEALLSDGRGFFCSDGGETLILPLTANRRREMETCYKVRTKYGHETLRRLETLVEAQKFAWEAAPKSVAISA
jgi:hypothetical protein